MTEFQNKHCASLKLGAFGRSNAFGRSKRSAGPFRPPRAGRASLLFIGLAFAAALPALAGTIATAATSARLHRIARADNVATHSTTAGTGQPAIASDSARQKNTPTAAAGGLLNTDATPAQAKAAARDTNRRIAQGQITPQKPTE